MRGILALTWLLHFLPLPVLHGVGVILGEVFFLLAGQRRRVTIRNLELCFPAKTSAWHRTVARAHFREMGKSLFEMGVFWYASRKRIEKLIDIRGQEHWSAHLQAPHILLAPHFVGLEWGAAAVGLCGVAGATMYARQKNPRLLAQIVRSRTRFAEHLLFSRQDGIKPLVKAIKQNRPFYYLPDQDFGPKESIFAPFFGVQAATVPALSRLCQLTGAKVIPCITTRLPWGRGYRVEFMPAWQNFPSGDLQQDTTRMNAFIEIQVLSMLPQYFWSHKRFKTRPEGEASFYGQDHH
jgi:Kdo2-lipid IVA lauroyltransferase/acyltransferase